MINNDALSPQQVNALAALMQSGTKRDAAKAAGVSEVTLYRWLREDDTFKAELRALQDSAIETAVSLLSGEARDAANTLVEIHKDTTVPAAVRVQAARAVLIENLKVREQNNLAERISVLEGKL